jgi:hypothetical protein
MTRAPIRHALVQAVGLVVLLALPAVGVAAAPVVTVGPATEVGPTTARVTGSIDPQGQEAVYRFEYISDELFDSNVADGLPGFVGADGAGFGFLSPSAGPTSLPPVTLEGLLPGVRYHLRLVAEGEEGALGVADAPTFFTAGGEPELPNPIPCDGDSCQVLPPEPVDPALGTLMAGPGNPKVRYHRYGKRRPQAKKRRDGKRKAGKGKKQAGKGTRR